VAAATGNSGFNFESDFTSLNLNKLNSWIDELQVVTVGSKLLMKNQIN